MPTEQQIADLHRQIAECRTRAELDALSATVYHENIRLWYEIGIPRAFFRRQAELTPQNEAGGDP